MYEPVRQHILVVERFDAGEYQIEQRGQSHVVRCGIVRPFYGEHEHKLDKKGRIIIPAAFREASKENYVEKFFVTRGLDKCLFMFPEEEWKQQEARFKGLSFTKREARKFNRLFFSGAIFPVRRALTSPG